MAAGVWGDALAKRVARTRQAYGWSVERFAEELTGRSTGLPGPGALRRPVMW